MTAYFSLNLNTKINVNGIKSNIILNAVNILKRDFNNTLEKSAEHVNYITVSAADSSMKRESWILEISPQEITVKGADCLACVYALLYISENFLGVAPFWFWNDQKFYKRGEIKIPAGAICSQEFAVCYRGWFVNDEVLIDNWPAEKTGGLQDHWAMVFEALLRCGGNITIPGTDENSRKNRSLAASMGLWITHHHAEPLGAQMFSRVYPDKVPSYLINGTLYEKLWEQAVIEQKDFNVIWNLGFRGQGDRPFWDDDPQFASAMQRGELISGIINKQIEIIKRNITNPVCCVNIYGEIVELYRGGYLKIPKEIIKIWGDNGYGRMVSRRQGNSNPRIHALPDNDGGLHGIYYHCSFHDLQASNHLTMSPNSAEFLAAELDKVFASGADRCWIVNSGSVKPHTHMLDLLREIWIHGKANADEWRKRYAEIYYGVENSGSIAALFDEYARCTAIYGPNEDDRAGEQIWHHPVREILCKWMSADTENCLKSLLWLTGDVNLLEQVKKIKSICDKTLPLWETFCKKCESIFLNMNEENKKYFYDSLYLHGRLHLHGAAGAKFFCDSFLAFVSGDMVKAFKMADKSRFHYEESVRLLEEAEHDKWAGYYKGDCLTDVRLTAICLNALVSYLRVLGDGPGFHKWEREYLTDEADRKVMLLSSKHRAMTNEELAKSLFVKN